MTTSGATTTDCITVASGVNADITLDGVSIDRSADVSQTSTACAFNMTGATVSLTLQGNSALTSGEGAAGLQAPAGSTLFIDGSGALVQRINNEQ